MYYVFVVQLLYQERNLSQIIFDLYGFQFWKMFGYVVYNLVGYVDDVIEVEIKCVN